jgi:HAD superfamily hydrolase (TIGR01490 family)
MDYFKAHNKRQWTHRIYMAYHFPLYIFKQMGLISDEAFRKPWPAHLGWYVRGYTLEEADQVWNWVAETQVSKNWRTDMCQVLRQHSEKGALTVLVSGTPVPLLERLAQDVNADHVVGTELEIKDGVFTGRNSSPACIGDNKVSLTRDYMLKKGIKIDYGASYAYADTISDQHMLAMVGHPVATYPDEALNQLALERGWQVFPPENS